MWKGKSGRPFAFTAGFACTVAAVLAIVGLALLPGAHADYQEVRNADELTQALKSGVRLINVTQSMIFGRDHLPLRARGRVSIVGGCSFDGWVASLMEDLEQTNLKVGRHACLLHFDSNGRGFELGDPDSVVVLRDLVLQGAAVDSPKEPTPPGPSTQGAPSRPPPGVPPATNAAPSGRRLAAVSRGGERRLLDAAQPRNPLPNQDDVAPPTEDPVPEEVPRERPPTDSSAPPDGPGATGQPGQVDPSLAEQERQPPVEPPPPPQTRTEQPAQVPPTSPQAPGQQPPGGSGAPPPLRSLGPLPPPPPRRPDPVPQPRGNVDDFDTPLPEEVARGVAVHEQLAGGSLLVYGGARVYMIQVLIFNSHAPNGGAVAVSGEGTELHVERGAMVLNMADRTGGALFVDQGAKANITDMYLCQNTASIGKAALVGEKSLVHFDPICCQQENCYEEVVLQHEKGTPDGQVVLPDGTQIGTPELLKLDPLKPFWPQEEDKDVLTPTSRKKEEPLEGLPVGREAPVATVSPPKKKSSGKVLLAVFLVIVLLGTLLTLFLLYKRGRLPFGKGRGGGRMSPGMYAGPDVGDVPVAIPLEALISQSSGLRPPLHSNSFGSGRNVRTLTPNRSLNSDAELDDRDEPTPPPAHASDIELSTLHSGKAKRSKSGKSKKSKDGKSKKKSSRPGDGDYLSPRLDPDGLGISSTVNPSYETSTVNPSFEIDHSGALVLAPPKTPAKDPPSQERSSNGSDVSSMPPLAAPPPAPATGSHMPPRPPRASETQSVNTSGAWDDIPVAGAQPSGQVDAAAEPVKGVQPVDLLSGTGAAPPPDAVQTSNGSAMEEPLIVTRPIGGASAPGRSSSPELGGLRLSLPAPPPDFIAEAVDKAPGPSRTPRALARSLTPTQPKNSPRQRDVLPPQPAQDRTATAAGGPVAEGSQWCHDSDAASPVMAAPVATSAALVGDGDESREAAECSPDNGNAGERRRWSRRGILDKARRPSAVRAEDVKAEAMIKASDGEEGEVPSYSTGRPFADGSAEEVSNNPFAGRMGAAGAGRGRGRLQASQWSLAAEAKNSKRLRKVAQQKAMLNRGESPSAQLFAISEDAEIRYSDCGLLYEVRAEEEGRAAAAAAAAAANSSGEAAPATTIGAEESASAPLEKSPAAKGAAVPGDGLPIQVKVDAALDEDSAEDSMALEEMGMIGGGAAEDSGDIAQSRPMSEMSAQLLGRYVQNDMEEEEEDFLR